MTPRPPKTHKRDSTYDTPICGLRSKRLSDVDAEVTCKLCRGYSGEDTDQEADNALADGSRGSLA